MQTQRSGEHRSIRPAQFTRQHIVRRNEEQVYYSGRIHEPGTDIAACGWAGVNSMKFNLRERNFMEVISKKGSHPLLKDSTNQVRLIERTLKTLSLNPNFNDTFQWDEHSELYEVLSWIIEKTSLLCNDHDWIINDKGEFEVYLPLDKIDTFWHIIPLNFLPLFEQRNKELYNLIVATVSLFRKKVLIPLWDDAEMEYALEGIKDDLEDNDEDDDPYYSHIRELVNEYETVASKYLYRIRDCKRTLSWLKNRLEGFEPADRIERRILRWLFKGYNLLDSKFNIQHFIHNPFKNQFYQYYPLLPERYFSFTWGIKDRVIEFAQESLDASYQEFGVEPFYQKHIIRSRKDWNFEKVKAPVWPKQLSEFFQEGYFIAEIFN